MKNHCIVILIGLFTLCGLTTANSLGILGSTTNIVAVKTGGLEVSFDLPSDLINKDGLLCSPMLIHLHRDDQTFFKTEVVYNHLLLPQLNLKQGKHYLTAEVAGFTSTISLTIL